MFRFSDPEEAPRLVLEEQTDHLLAEAKSEILKQDCKVDLLNTCIRECQRQVHSNRLEMDYEIMGVKDLEKSRPDFMKNWEN